MNEVPSPTPTDPSVATAEVLGTRVGYTREAGHGEAVPVLMVPGLPGGPADFRYLAPLVAAKRPAIRLELPGFGAHREATWHDYSPLGRARLVLGLADALGLERFAVLGHSMGAPAAIAAAAAFPERVVALVALASPGFRRHRSMLVPPPIARALALASHVPLVGHALTRAVRRQYVRFRFPGAERYTARDIRTHAAFVARYDFDAARRAAEAVRCPTLVAFAEDDRLVQVPILEELAAAIPDAVVARWPTGGHNIQKSRAPELASAIEALLARAGA